MFLGKNKEKLSVELVDMAVDTSEVINIKNSKVVYINGAGKLKEVYKALFLQKDSFCRKISSERKRLSKERGLFLIF